MILWHSGMSGLCIQICLLNVILHSNFSHGLFFSKYLCDSKFLQLQMICYDSPKEVTCPFKESVVIISKLICFKSEIDMCSKQNARGRFTKTLCAIAKVTITPHIKKSEN